MLLRAFKRLKKRGCYGIETENKLYWEFLLCPPIHKYWRTMRNVLTSNSTMHNQVSDKTNACQDTH